jgi:hypothetical protein
MEIIIAITVLFYFIANTIYMQFAPTIPYVEVPANAVYWNCFYYIVQYGLSFMSGLIIYRLTPSKVSKLFALSLMIYSICFFIYYNLIINASLPTYIDYCNSKEFSLLFSVLIFAIISIIFIIFYHDKIIKFFKKYEKI